MRQTFYTTLLSRLYGAEAAASIEPHLQKIIDTYCKKHPLPPFTPLSERDALIITYGDQVQAPDKPHLKTLSKFCRAHLCGMVSGIHILPFFPWSSDDGFSVLDFRAVDPNLGNWEDIESIGSFFRLMVDGVINHASVQGKWFQGFLQNETRYRNYFITVEGDADLSEVVRPRALPLLTEFHTTSGIRRVWTTFSADQADLDYHNPEVLLEMIDILLMYVGRGAQFMRLDAIAYLWKEIGTACIHLPQTHAVIQLLRAVFDEAAPHVHLITETNVSHLENISYFGNGTNEAHLVYNFALPPLVLHTFRTGDATILSEWAIGQEVPSKQTAFLNFLASHDGIGLNPVRGILSSEEIEALANQAIDHGGFISFKQNSDGTQSPYELNINYFDALSNPAANEPQEIQIDRFMASQAILLSLRGVPGIYFHSLFGSRNWMEGVQITGQKRSINRQKLNRDNLEADLSNPASLRARVFERYRHLLQQRNANAAFHPHGEQKILDMGRSVFAVLRISPAGNKKILCLQNISALPQTAGKHFLKPYQTLWLDEL